MEPIGTDDIPRLEDGGAATPFAPPEPEHTAVYRGGRLIDVTAPGVPALPGMTLVIRGERVAAVLPDEGVGRDLLSRAQTVVDLDGAWVLPGFVDSHQHLATPPHRALAERLLARQVRAGVTAIRIMADDLRSVADLAPATFTGEIAGPAIRFAALVADRSFFDDPRTGEASQGGQRGAVPWMQAVDPQSDIGETVTLARGTGACAIKIYANLDGDIVARLVGEAHRQGLLAWSHAGIFPATPAQVIGAGMDAVSHADLLVYHTVAESPRSYREGHACRSRAYEAFLVSPPDSLDGLLGEMVRRGTVLDATASLAGLGRPGREDAVHMMAREATRRIVRRAASLGVVLAAGTDYETPLDDAFPSLYREVAYLAGPVGLEPPEVLRAATLGGARAMGTLDDMDTLEPGKLANAVVLAEDPREDISQLRSLRFTLARGLRMDPIGGAAVWPGSAGCL